jgi:hypothetical protein
MLWNGSVAALLIHGSGNRRSIRLLKEQIADIAALQQTIAAMEAVIVDLDAETHFVFRETASTSLCGVRFSPCDSGEK